MDDTSKSVTDIYSMRPWKDKHGKAWVTSPDGKSKVPTDRKAYLTMEQWFEVDNKVLSVFKEHAPLANWIAERASFSGFDGLVKTVFETIEPQRASKDGATYRLEALPLPITYSNCLIRISAAGDMKLDSVVRSAKVVAEKVDKTVINGIGQVRGLLNARGVMHTAGSINSGIKALRSSHGEINCGFYGPYCVVVPDLQDRNSKAREGAKRQIERDYMAINGISGVVFTPHTDQQILFQITPDAVRMVIGRDPVCVQCRDDPPLYRVLTVFVPHVRANANGNTGVCILRG